MRTIIFVCAGTLLSLCTYTAASAQQLPGYDAHDTQAVAVTTVLNPDPPSALSTQPVDISPEQHELMLTRMRQIEESSAATAQNNPPSPPGLPPVEGQGTDPSR
jgi:hypothetical protein